MADAVPVRLNSLGQNDENKNQAGLPGWPILPNLSENYLQCSLAELEEEEFDQLDLADMNETTHDGNWDKWRPVSLLWSDSSLIAASAETLKNRESIHFAKFAHDTCANTFFGRIHSFY